jgi:hypothetical protein
MTHRVLALSLTFALLGMTSHSGMRSAIRTHRIIWPSIRISTGAKDTMS